MQTKSVISLATAKKAASAAEQEANKAGLQVSIAVVDDGANLLYLARMDDATIASAEIAHRKARTAALFKRATKEFETGLGSGRSSLLTLDIVAFEGGVPILVDGKIAGAIGVSGASAEQDGAIAQAGVAALGL